GRLDSRTSRKTRVTPPRRKKSRIVRNRALAWPSRRCACRIARFRISPSSLICRPITKPVIRLANSPTKMVADVSACLARASGAQAAASGDSSMMAVSAVASADRNSRTRKGSSTMLRGAFPEDFGVGAADVVGIERQGVAYLPCRDALPCNEADGRRQQWIGRDDGLAAGGSLRPGRLFGQAGRVERDPSNGGTGRLVCDELQEGRGRQNRLVADQLQTNPRTPVEAGKNLLPASVDEWRNEGGASMGLRRQSFEAGDWH